MAILPGDGPPGRDECDASPALGMTTNPLPVTRYPLPVLRLPFRATPMYARLVAALGSSGQLGAPARGRRPAASGKQLQAAASSSQLLLFPLPATRLPPHSPS